MISAAPIYKKTAFTVLSYAFHLLIFISYGFIPYNHVLISCVLIPYISIHHESIVLKIAMLSENKDAFETVYFWLSHSP